MAITPAQIAADVVALLAAYKLYDEEFQDWVQGAADGGDLSDGVFPLTSRIDGTVRDTKSPARLEDDVNGLVVSSAAHAAAALASETAAGLSETAAALSETNASTHKDNAVTAQSAAEAAQSAAENAEVNAIAQAGVATAQAVLAATSYDDFDDRYLGQKASDPTLDNDGDALLTGATYFNTATNEMKVYTGSAWQNAFNTTEVNDLTAAVTWANVPDANITVGSVTQHVGSIDHDALLNFAAGEHFTMAAISITESQISDLGSYLPLAGGTITVDLTVEGALNVGKDTGGDSVLSFYDDTNNTLRSIFWDDSESAFFFEIDDGTFKQFGTGSGGGPDLLLGGM